MNTTLLNCGGLSRHFRHSLLCLAALVASGLAQAAGPQLFPEALSDSSYVLTASGEIYRWGKMVETVPIVSQTAPLPIPMPAGVTQWLDMSASDTYFMLLGNDGQLYALAGTNYAGQCGIGTTAVPRTLTRVVLPLGVTSWTKVRCGKAHTLAVGNNTELYGWGFNIYGQLGTGSVLGTNSTPARVTKPSGVLQWVALATGSNHSLAIDQRGQVYSWGLNSSGQLGFGNTLNQSQPMQVTNLPAGGCQTIACGSTFSMALLSNGQLYAWGNNTYGQVGPAGGTNSTTRPLLVPAPSGSSGWSAISASSASAFGVTDDNRPFAWGANLYGQLGLGTTNLTGIAVPSPMALPSGVSRWAQIQGGRIHTLVLGDDCRLYGCGNSAYGQLGSIGMPVNPNLVVGVPDLCNAAGGPPVVNIFPIVTNAYEPPYGTNATSLMFQLWRSGSVTDPVTVTLDLSGTATSGIDYTAPDSTVLIPAGERSQFLTLPVLADSVGEGTETVILTLQSSSAAIGAYNRVAANIIDPVALTNRAPGARIISPVAGSIFTNDTSIAISAIAWDVDGTVSTVEFSANGIRLAFFTNSNPTIGATNTYSFVWSNMLGGSYPLLARATDNLGKTWDSWTNYIFIISTAANNTPPAGFIWAPADGAVFPFNYPFYLQANASDSDGWVSSVEFFEGSTSLGLVVNTNFPGFGVAQTFSVRISGLAPGTHYFYARITDNWGATYNTTTSSLTINPPPNQIPIVYMESPTNGLYTNDAIIEVSAIAWDTDGTVSTLELRANTNILMIFTNNNPVVGATNTYSYAWSNMPPGSYALWARATDNQGAGWGSGSSNYVYIVGTSSNNIAPSAYINFPGNGTTFAYGHTIQLNIYASDADGWLTNAEFFEGSASLGRSTNCSVYPFGAWFNVYLTNVAPGTHYFYAQVTDNWGATGTTPTNWFIVNAPSNDYPHVYFNTPLDGALVTSNSNILILAEAYDPDGTITNACVYDGPNLLACFTTNSAVPGAMNYYSLRWSDVPYGPHSLWAVAMDDAGAVVMVTNNVTVTNIPANIPPSVRMLSPADGSTFMTNTLVQLTAEAGDADGRVLMVDFLDSGSRIGTVTNTGQATGVTNTYTYNWRLYSGTHHISARATDNAGTQITTPSISITATSLLSYAPTVRMLSPLSSPTFPSNASVQLVASASDRDGWIATLEFLLCSNTIVTLTNANHTIGLTNQFSFICSNLLPGVYQVFAAATDNSGQRRISSYVLFTVGGDTNMVGNLPSLQITSPPDWTRFMVGAPINFVIRATPIYGTRLNLVDLYDGTNQFSRIYNQGTNNSFPYYFTWTNPPPQDHFVMARGLDATGQGVVSVPIHIVTTFSTNLLTQGIFNSGMPGRSAEVYFYVPSGYNYTVQGSTNLLDWVNLTNLYSTSGVIWFSDANATNTANQFYRAVPGP